MNSDELLYKIAVSLIPHVGSTLTRNLVSYLGSVEAIFREKKRNLLKVPGVGEYVAEKIIQSNTIEAAREELAFIGRNNIKAYFYLDEGYPERLKNCNDSPILLYTKGNASMNGEKFIGIVGTRKATPEGIDNCNKLLADLKSVGYSPVIISGLAYGIDIAAHKAALKEGLPTLAVLANGLSTIYPSAHKNTASQIIQNGLLITETSSKAPLEKANFVKRNRIIAGLSDAVIIVESGERGGALITADIACSYNRDVFAFPGRTTDVYSRGCNKLIKTNKAALIEQAEDLEYLMGWERPDAKKAPVQRKLFIELTDDEKKIASLLTERNELTIDQLALTLSQPVSHISAQLLNMEFQGLIKSLPGKVYKYIG